MKTYLYKVIIAVKDPGNLAKCKTSYGLVVGEDKHTAAANVRARLCAEHPCAIGIDVTVLPRIE